MLNKKATTDLFKLFCIIYILLFIHGCKCKNDKPDIDGISLNIQLNRFEKDLFSIDTVNIIQSISLLLNKYGNFFNLFAFQITALGSSDSILMAEHFRNFVTDSNFRAIYQDCNKLFSDFSDKEKELTKAFQYYKYYFPDKIIPRIVTMISGFSYPIVCDSTNLGISLDMYLGPSYKYYSTLEPPLPSYLRNRMQKEYLVADAMKGWVASDYSIDESNAKMLDFMISQGRLLYFLDKILPETHDTLKSGYTNRQLEWCRANEKNIWSFFIENKLLFSMDPNLMNKYVNEGPTTNGFPKDSPGNIGQFIGWNIIHSYMNNNSSVTLQQLMNEKDLVKIFNASKYKPERN
jgi:gliding motility-associated lipoprotein GldB